MPELHLDLTSEQVGRVCGKGGATIREIRSTTGALLDWHKKFATGSPGTLVVKGLQPQIEQAYAEVQAVLKIEPPACPRGRAQLLRMPPMHELHPFPERSLANQDANAKQGRLS